METKEYNYTEILEDVTRISTALMIGKKAEGIEPEPFYGHFFSGLIKSISPDTDTLAVGYNNGLITLYINPKFWMDDLNSLPFKLGGIKHEILHIVYKHIFRYKGFSHKTIFNVAADLVVNQYIKPEQLIKGTVLLSDFPELNLDPHEHINYYYTLLMDLYKNCSSGENKGEPENNTSWKNLKSLLDQENEWQKRHDLWRNADKLSSAEKEIAEAALNQSIENTLRRVKFEDFGKLPAELQQYLRDLESSLIPVINWKRILRLFVSSSSRTHIKNTLRRPSKRYGTNPGIKVKKRHKILIALDTSGSISLDELREFFNEIYHIWKQDAEVLVVECDTEIHQTYFYKGKNPQTVSGGGGTAFEAPIKYANETYRPDALIYFTDGYGANPFIKSNCPILWFLSKNGADPDYIKDFQGRKVKMN